MQRRGTEVCNKSPVLKNRIWICFENEGKNSRNRSTRIWKQAIRSIPNKQSNNRTTLKFISRFIGRLMRIKRTNIAKYSFIRRNKDHILILINILNSKNPILMSNPKRRSVIVIKNKRIIVVKNQKNSTNKKDRRNSRRECFLQWWENLSQWSLISRLKILHFKSKWTNQWILLISRS